MIQMLKDAPMTTVFSAASAINSVRDGDAGLSFAGDSRQFHFHFSAGLDEDGKGEATKFQN